MSEDYSQVAQLVSAISAQAEEERKSILESAQKLVAEIEAEAEARVDRIRSKLESAHERQLERERGRILGAARVRMDAELLTLRRRLVKKVFDQVDKKLADLPLERNYPEIFFDLLSDALEAFGPEAATVEVSQAEIEIATRSLRQIGIRAEGVELRGAKLSHGSIRVFDSLKKRVVDGSLSSRAAIARERLSSQVAAILFEVPARP